MPLEAKKNPLGDLMYRGERGLEAKDGAKSFLYNNNRGGRVLINKYGGLFVEEKWPARPRGGASAAVKPPEQPKRNNGHLGKRGFFQPRGAWF
ncbi:hypothetical protein AMTRI_Chr02g214600 [Amborella trichopoda]